MDDAGQKMKQARERLSLRVRDVQEASEKIAEKHKNDKFAVLINSLSDIENRGLVPTIYKLYSLCTIYRLDMDVALSWYGIERSEMIIDAQVIEIERTHQAHFQPGAHGDLLLPISLDPGIDVRRTTYLSRMIQRWGRLPLKLLEAMDPVNQRYGFIGTDDWFMYPLLQPGSLVVIDESRRKVVQGSWNTELERPLYFLEHRHGFECAWCVVERDRLTMIPHPLSGALPRCFGYPGEIEIVGQVTGIAMRLDQGRKRRTHSAAEP